VEEIYFFASLAVGPFDLGAPIIYERLKIAPFSAPRA
jgi:hypothetical protein